MLALLGPDLCASKQPLCSHNSLCINTLGSYSCVCQHGYYDVSSVTERAPASHPVCQGTETSHQSLKPMYFILKAHPLKKTACVAVQLLIFLFCFFDPRFQTEKGLFSRCLDKLMAGAIAKPYLHSRMGGAVAVKLNDGRCIVNESETLYYFRTSRKVSECGTEKQVSN